MIFRSSLAPRTAQAVPPPTTPSCGPFSRWAFLFRERTSSLPTFRGCPRGIRSANKDGFLARREDQEIVIAMNPDSFARDLASVAPGGAFYYSDDIKQPITRADIAVY